MELNFVEQEIALNPFTSSHSYITVKKLQVKYSTGEEKSFLETFYRIWMYLKIVCDKRWKKHILPRMIWTLSFNWNYIRGLLKKSQLDRLIQIKPSNQTEFVLKYVFVQRPSYIRVTFMAFIQSTDVDCSRSSVSEYFVSYFFFVLFSAAQLLALCLCYQARRLKSRSEFSYYAITFTNK